MLRYQETPPSEQSRGHEMVHVLCVVLAFVSQICSEAIFILNMYNGPLISDQYYNATSSTHLEVCMDSWSSFYWILIDIWTLFWLLEALVSCFRRNALGRTCCNPEIHSPLFYVLWIIVNTARICSVLLVWRHDLVENVSLVWSLPVFSFFMLGWSYINLQKHRAWLSINYPSRIGWISLTTQNGLAMFAWWTFLKSAISLGVLLKDVAGVEDVVASSVVLTVILVASFIWFVFQSFVVPKYMRHTITVYPTLVVGLGSMFTHSYMINTFSSTSMYCGFLMLAATGMSLVHLVSTCLYQDRPRNQPRHMEPRMVLQTVYQPYNNKPTF